MHEINELQLKIIYGADFHKIFSSRLMKGAITAPNRPIEVTAETIVFLTYVGYDNEVYTYAELNTAEANALPINAKKIAKYLFA